MKQSGHVNPVALAVSTVAATISMTIQYSTGASELLEQLAGEHVKASSVATFFTMLSAFIGIMIGVIARVKPAPGPRVVRRYVAGPPGSRLHVAAVFFYSRKTVERVFDPMLKDMRDEYFEALAKAQTWKARWVHARYYWSFTAAVCQGFGFSLLDGVVRVFKALT
ncbi:hypothetical protein WMF45_34630 [Sorangium sp. So ce448]|uniref:hypothetical protein n=1 Tax=Sorangium sp. So ce448 TaxID=3133314 RepID=UPI003F5DBFFF